MKKNPESPKKRGVLNPATLKFENLKAGMWVAVLGDRPSEEDENESSHPPFGEPEPQVLKSLISINGSIPGLGGMRPPQGGGDDADLQDGAPLRVFSVHLPFVVCGVFRPYNMFADKPLIIDLRETELIEIPASYVRGILRLHRSRGTLVFKTRRKKTPNYQSLPGKTSPSTPKPVSSPSPTANPSIGSFLESLKRGTPTPPQSQTPPNDDKPSE